MSFLYELIGRLVVRFVRVRYGRTIKAGVAIATVAGLAAGYLALTRGGVEEG